MSKIFPVDDFVVFLIVFSNYKCQKNVTYTWDDKKCDNLILQKNVMSKEQAKKVKLLMFQMAMQEIFYLKEIWQKFAIMKV